MIEREWNSKTKAEMLRFNSSLFLFLIFFSKEDKLVLQWMAGRAKQFRSKEQRKKMEYLIKTIKKWEDEIFAIVCSLIVFSVLCFFWSKKEEYPFINNFFTESACDTYEIDRDIDQERRKYYENLRKENGKGKVWDEKYAEFNSWRLKNEGITNK